MATVSDDEWQRSTLCSANSCIKVKRLPTGEIAIAGGILCMGDQPLPGYVSVFGQAFSTDEWLAFVAGVKAGDFDHIGG